MKRLCCKMAGAMLVAALIVMLAGVTAWAKNPKNEVFVIGDSLSDPGNFHALTGFWPPSPPYAQRFCNGPVWTEYFANRMEVPVSSSAYGGAFSGVFVVDGVPLSNYNNVQYPDLFTAMLPGVAEEVDALLANRPGGLNPDALYVVWAGANDFFLGLGAGTLPDVLPQTITNLGEAICRLGAAGARHFAVGNMPDIGLTPFAAGLPPGTAASLSATIAGFNTQLSQALAGLPSSCAETLVLLDTYQIVRDLALNPAAYGLINVTEACLDSAAGTVCSAPDTYLFWDSVHPTTVVQSVFADRLRSVFCGTGPLHPGLRMRPATRAPAVWRGVCYGTR